MPQHTLVLLFSVKVFSFHFFSLGATELTDEVSVVPASSPGVLGGASTMGLVGPGPTESEAGVDDGTAVATTDGGFACPSGYFEYGGSCSVCPSGPIMSCSSPSGPILLWKSLFLLVAGKPITAAGSVTEASSSAGSVAWLYKAYGNAGAA